MHDSPKFDIFVSSGRLNFPDLRRLLPQLHSHGRVHVFSSFLSDRQIEGIRPRVHMAHQPVYDKNGYDNFNIACTKDINRLASAPYFIKLDTDVNLEEGWMDYVEECMVDYPDAVLFGPEKGRHDINIEINGTAAREALGREVQVERGLKIAGSFYVGQTTFWKKHDHTMQALIGVLYPRYSLNSRRNRHGQGDGDSACEVNVVADGSLGAGKYKEDILRSLTVHVAGASDRLKVIDSKGRISVELNRHPVNRPSRLFRT